MKYCSHQHKNPDDAMFCHECGEKLQEAVKGNKCPKCNQENPKDARFCFNCGCSLVEKPEPQEFYTLKVRSKKVCDKIFVKGQKYHSNIISKNSDGEFRVPKSDPVVDVIYESEGIEYKYNVDCRKTNDFYISWGDIIFSSDCICEEIKISGSNMPTPLVLKNIQKKVLSVPAGKSYDVEAIYDGKIKKSTVFAKLLETTEVKINFTTDNSGATTEDSDEKSVTLTPNRYTTTTTKSSSASKTSSNDDPPAYQPLLVGIICLLIGYALWPSKWTFYLMGFGGILLCYGIILAIGELINYIKKL